jgi:hypothetical protein
MKAHYSRAGLHVSSISPVLGRIGAACWMERVTDDSTAETVASARNEGAQLRATVMYAAHDVRVEIVPDARLVEPTDALVRVTRACICVSDLWPYNSMTSTDTGNRIGRSPGPP